MSSNSNVSMFVDRFGDGDPILLVHGLGSSSNSWRALINALQDSYQLIVPDLPGSGRTPVSNPLTVESLADDLWSLLDASGVQQVRLIGHSMGTIVCQHMAAAQTKRVTSMILLGPLAEPPEPARGALNDRAASARNGGMQAIADTISDVALSAHTKTHKGNIQGFIRELLIAQDPSGYAASCEALALAMSANASALTMPTLLVTGDEDGVAPPANVQKLEELLPNATMHVLENCGHWTVNERPAAVIELVNRFLAAH